MELGCDQPDATGMVTLLISHCGATHGCFQAQTAPDFQILAMAVVRLAGRCCREVNPKGVYKYTPRLLSGVRGCGLRFFAGGRGERRQCLTAASWVPDN